MIHTGKLFATSFNRANIFFSENLNLFESLMYGNGISEDFRLYKVPRFLTEKHEHIILFFH